MINVECEMNTASDLCGGCTVIDEGDDFKVKRIEVLPEKRLSYQKHKHRAEHRFVVRGTAKVTLNDEEILVRAGEVIDIALGDAHRVANPESSQTLIFIETQRGYSSAIIFSTATSKFSAVKSGCLVRLPISFRP